MNSFNNPLGRLPFILRILLAIPWTIFWILYAIVIAPFQIAYHWSSAGEQSSHNFNRDYSDQDFKRAIALIELHKLRFSEYPESLQEQNFQDLLGKWDKSIYRSVEYSRQDSGYELNLKSQDSLQLEYPPGFWRGLGITKTNVKGFQGYCSLA